jgi:hypothetical protein
MDVKVFQDARATDLANFKKQYKVLKDEYSAAMTSAIEETDDTKRDVSVKRVLDVNANMVNEIRSMVAAMTRGKDGFNQKDLTSLENDLIEYQKEYAEIEKSKDKVNTLKKVKETTEKNLESVTGTYYILLGGFLFLCLVTVFLVLRTSWITSYISSPARAAPRTPRATY